MEEIKVSQSQNMNKEIEDRAGMVCGITCGPLSGYSCGTGCSGADGSWCGWGC